MSKIDKLMDVVRIGGDDEGAGPVVIEEATDGSASGVKLHPLVIINISEHFTRIRSQNDGAGQTVLGLLLGVQSGRHVELFNSFEMVAEVVADADGKPLIQFEAEFLKDKLLQFKEVFPKLDLLGWYCTGTELTAQHLEIHTQMLSLGDSVYFKDSETKNLTLSEAPLLLLLDPTPRPHARELPLRIFEHHIEIVGNVQKTSFVTLGYSLASEEAERIGVDHIAKVSGSGGQDKASEVSIYLDTQRGAVVMLQQRIKIIRNYLRDVRDGKLERNNELLRLLSALCSRLPITTDGDSGGASFLENANDSMLVSYLAMVTKGCSAISEVLDKFPMVHDKGNRRSRAFY
eukprot:m.92951 g.92951  ORF g.92951 m.92951 type:complete len:346 (-) comp20258_c0_seq1:155-1192(-)